MENIKKLYSEETVVEELIKSLKSYDEANGVYELGLSADSLATSTETVLQMISETTPSLREVIQKFFKTRSPKK